MKTFFEKKSLEPRLSNYGEAINGSYKDYYYKYKALKYYLKNNSIEKQIKGGTNNEQELLQFLEKNKNELLKDINDNENIKQNINKLEEAINIISRENQSNKKNATEVFNIINTDNFIKVLNSVTLDPTTNPRNNEKYHTNRIEVLKQQLNNLLITYKIQPILEDEYYPFFIMYGGTKALKIYIISNLFRF